MNYNKAVLIGNVARDPEMRSLPSGIPVASFAIATNRTWKDPSGQRKEDTQFHNIVVFGKTADVVSKYARKGALLMVEGRIQTRSWDDKAGGGKKYRTEIVADRIQLGPRGGPAGAAPSGGFGGAAGGAPMPMDIDTAPQDSKNSSDVIEYPDENINVDDIPF